jgi:hypothetical protein
MIVVVMVNFHGLALTPLGSRVLAAAKLLPSLKERLLSLHQLRPEKIRFSERVAAVDNGRGDQGLR